MRVRSSDSPSAPRRCSPRRSTRRSGRWSAAPSPASRSSSGASRRRGRRAAPRPARCRRGGGAAARAGLLAGRLTRCSHDAARRVTPIPPPTQLRLSRRGQPPRVAALSTWGRPSRSGPSARALPRLLGREGPRRAPCPRSAAAGASATGRGPACRRRSRAGLRGRRGSAGRLSRKSRFSTTFSRRKNSSWMNRLSRCSHQSFPSAGSSGPISRSSRLTSPVSRRRRR